MSIQITQLPKDVLALIATYVCFNRPRSRWAVYAVFRLVCQRFRSCIPLKMMASALDADIRELPMVCAEEYNLEEPQYQGGMRRIAVYIDELTHALYYILLPERMVKKTISSIYPTILSFECNKHGSIVPEVSFVLNTDYPFPPIMFPVDTPRHTILEKLLSYLKMFRRHGVSNQAKHVWLCVSTSYHVYIRYLLEKDPTWYNKVEPLQKKGKFMNTGEYF